jgi:hypothetical protein
MKESIRDKLLETDIPGDVPHWIVEFHAEFDDPDLTPMRAVRLAIQNIYRGHCWTITHVRSGLMWSVDLERNECFEIRVLKPEAKIDD